MKKVIVAMLAAMMLMLSSVAMAAGDGTVLNKQQRSAEVVMDSMQNEAVTYSAVSKGLTKELAAKLNEETYAALQKQVKKQMGELKKTTFYSFQRYPQADVVVYIGEFSKEKQVLMQFLFDKQGKMAEFTFSPLVQQQQQQQPAQGK